MECIDLTQDQYPTPNSMPDRTEIAIPTRSLDQGAIFQRFNLKTLFRRRARRLPRADVVKLALNKPTIRRLARRGGVKRINSEIYDTTQKIMEARLREILSKCIEIVNHQGRKTLTSLDVVYALRVLGNPIYGVGFISHGDNVKCRASYYRIKKKQQAENRKRVAQELREAAEESRREAGEERSRRVDANIRAMMRGAR